MNWFKSHGTKIIGGATTALGVLGAVDPNVLAGVLGPQGMAYVAAVGGLLTILRGFQNSANQTPPPAS